MGGVITINQFIALVHEIKFCPDQKERNEIGQVWPIDPIIYNLELLEKQEESISDYRFFIKDQIKSIFFPW